MTTKVRNVFFVVLGVAGLLLKGQYAGPFQQAVASHASNVSVSFAVYFVVSFLPFQVRYRKLVTAALALAVVEGFEATNGFGVMTNVYDEVDFAANAVGIGLALAVDAVVSRTSGRAPRQGGRPA